MRTPSILCLLVINLLFLQSCSTDKCSTKDSFVEHFEAFAKEFEEKKAKLDEEEKKAYELRYQDIVNNCYKKFKTEMSLQEKQDFWKQSLGFYVARYDGQFSSMLLTKSDDRNRV